MRRALLCLTLIFALAADALGISHIRFSSQEISGSGVNAQGVALGIELAASVGRLRASVAKLTRQGQSWNDTELSCAAFTLGREQIRCNGGTIKALGQTLPFDLLVDNTPSINLSSGPKAGENWSLSARRAGARWSGRLRVVNGDVARFGALIPENQPRPSNGLLNATLEGSLTAAGRVQVNAETAIQGVDFADAEGLHAGEKIDARLRLNAVYEAKRWGWQASLDWLKGEVFWQPVYLKAGHRLVAQGWLDQDNVQLERARIELAGIGAAELAGRFRRADRSAVDFLLRCRDIQLAELYSVFLNPFLEKTALNALQIQGQGDLEWRYQQGATKAFDLRLAGTSVIDTHGRFKLNAVNARVPWVNDQPSEAVIEFDSAALGRFPIGRVAMRARVHGYNLEVPELTLPVLDGTLKLEGIKARRDKDEWTWEFSGELTPISLPRLTKSLEWPEMAGSLSGVIPKVSYAKNVVQVSGALQFRVFDGIVVATNLELADPLGRAAHFKGQVVMSNLDLELLTKTFSFGKIQGRIDASVEDMELANWKPVHFDGRVMSSPGNYPRKISQQAVQNISALGGGGAAAAIQRSFLRMFEEFRYRNMGLTCKLRNNVCIMGGVADTPQGYVIVQGGGVPAITVMGYNRVVGWEELLKRVQAATQSNTKPVVQ